MAVSPQPPPEVVAGFGADGSTLHLLTGGQGHTWRAGDIVLRPHGNAEEASWKSGVLATLVHTADFRTARPVPTRDGEWTSGEWEAWQWLPGLADESRVIDVIRAGAAFHRAISSLERPAFIARADNAWSRADRMVWEDDPLPRHCMLDRLAAEFHPISSPSQVIHADLLGNVLFAPLAPPTIIDWAPYWRPAALAGAVAAVDAACWHGWPPDRLGELGDQDPDWWQLLVRALAFRMATLHLLGQWTTAMDDVHEPVVAALLTAKWRP